MPSILDAAELGVQGLRFRRTGLPGTGRTTLTGFAEAILKAWTI
jgi:hypothetical protein